jgi:hypothetical protein
MCQLRILVLKINLANSKIWIAVKPILSTYKIISQHKIINRWVCLYINNVSVRTDIWLPRKKLSFNRSTTPYTACNAPRLVAKRWVIGEDAVCLYTNRADSSQRNASPSSYFDSPHPFLHSPPTSTNLPRWATIFWHGERQLFLHPRQ